MTIVRWEPLRELELPPDRDEPAVQRGVRRRRPAATAAPRRWTPAMDLLETEDQFVLRADLPGMSEDDVNDRARGQRAHRLRRAQDRARGQARGLLPHGARVRLVLPLARRCPRASTPRRSARRSTAACSRCASRSPSSASRARISITAATASRARSRARRPSRSRSREGPPRAGPLLSYGARWRHRSRSTRAIPARAPAPARSTSTTARCARPRSSRSRRRRSSRRSRSPRPASWATTWCCRTRSTCSSRRATSWWSGSAACTTSCAGTSR